MHSDSNPFQAPSSPSGDYTTGVVGKTGWTLRRAIAVLLLATPFIVARPIAYWAYHVAGGWFVSTDIDASQRTAFVAMMYIMLMASITVLAMFAAFLLLWIDRWLPRLTGVLTVIFGVLLLPSLYFLLTGVASYFAFG